MREDEFEKQVRDKMKHLGFDPSEAVWTGVDREINQKKKRRAPLFWLFFVPGLLLAGGAYHFIANKNGSGTIPNISGQEKIAKKQNEDQTAQSGKLQKNIQGQTNDLVTNDATGSDKEKTHFAGPVSKGQKPVDHSGRRFVQKEKSSVNGKTKRSNQFKQNSLAEGAGDIVVNHYDDKPAKTEIEKVNKEMIDSAAGKMIAGEKENKVKKDSVISPATAKNKEKKTKESSWNWGITGGIGSSNLNQNLFKSVKTLSPVSMSAGPAAAPSGGNINYSSSEINPGFSYQAGAFVSRNFSKRFSVSAGVNYHYYSTTMRTGMKINTTLVTTNSINQTIVADSYYENTRTQTFTNQYHLIEVPVSANIQLNKSKRMPFIWELGVAPGYIISSNALYYDPNTNLYFSKYLQPNKIQFNGVTALMIGFPLYKGQLQLGPQLQYGFTGFVNTNDGNPGHLFYVGLKISFIPGKK